MSQVFINLIKFALRVNHHGYLCRNFFFMCRVRMGRGLKQLSPRKGKAKPFFQYYFLFMFSVVGRSPSWAPLCLYPGGKDLRSWYRRKLRGMGMWEMHGICRVFSSSFSVCIMDSFSEVAKTDCNLILKKKNLNLWQRSFIFSRDMIMHFKMQ